MQEKCKKNKLQSIANFWFQKCNINQHSTGVTHFAPGWIPKSDQKVKESEGGVQENLCEWHGSVKFSDERLSYRFDTNVANFLKFQDSAMDFS